MGGREKRKVVAPKGKREKNNSVFAKQGAYNKNKTITNHGCSWNPLEALWPWRPWSVEALVLGECPKTRSNRAMANNSAFFSFSLVFQYVFNLFFTVYFRLINSFNMF